MSTHPVINDCWNKIGVWGDGSCPVLPPHVHCRNCPVYSRAAIDLLETELPPGYRTEKTAHFAHAAASSEKLTESAVIFRLGLEWFGLPTAVFEEAATRRLVRSLPHRRNRVVLGITNVRGDLLICVSLALLLGLDLTLQPLKSSNNSPRLLVINREGQRFAFPVDEVQGVHRYSARGLQALPTTLAKTIASYTRAVLPWCERAVGLLDESVLFETLKRSLA
jgi:chemotaxis-related protein WspD